jgi:MATE family multidrug resistance protein
VVSWFCGSFFMGVGAGVQAITSRRMGEGRPEGAVVALHAALGVALFFVIPFSLLLASGAGWIFETVSHDPEVVAAGTPYLRVRILAICFVSANFAFRGYWNGVGRTAIYMRIIITMHALNIFLNWVLIYGNLGAPAMGVTGAGLASSIALGVGTLAHTGVVYRYADGFLKRFEGYRRNLKAVVVLSTPAGVQNLFFSAGYVAIFAIAQKIGTQELAAANVLIALTLTCVLPALGLGLAAATLVGQSLGKDRKDHAMTWTWASVQLGFMVLAGLGGLLAVAPNLWVGFLVHDEYTRGLCIAPLLLLACFQPIDSIGVILSKVMMDGAGAARTVMVISVSLQWFLFLPCAYFVSVEMGGSLMDLWMIKMAWRTLFSLMMMLAVRRGKWTEIKV